VQSADGEAEMGLFLVLVGVAGIILSVWKYLVYSLVDVEIKRLDRAVNVLSHWPSSARFGGGNFGEK
jgi:hypothetical protein